jgi:hypothetical protein
LVVVVVEEASLVEDEDVEHEQQENWIAAGREVADQVSANRCLHCLDVHEIIEQF